MQGVSFPRMVELDAVTGLPPRKMLDKDLPVLLRAMGPPGLPMCAIMIDIDHFKRFNDKYGHKIGDLVLRHVSSIIRKSVKFRGEAYRYGGEEITVLLLNTTGAEGLVTAQRICSAVGNSEIVAMVKGKEELLNVRISLGVASTDTVAGSEVLVCADQSVYKAKSFGRNQAVLFKKNAGRFYATTTIDVHFPGTTSIIGGTYILLKKWFSRGDISEIEARVIKDPNNDTADFAEAPVPFFGVVEAEIRGKVSAIERHKGHTYFKFEVKSEIIDLMFKYIQDANNANN